MPVAVVGLVGQNTTRAGGVEIHRPAIAGNAGKAATAQIQVVPEPRSLTVTTFAPELTVKPLRTWVTDDPVTPPSWNVPPPITKADDSFSTVPGLIDESMFSVPLLTVVGPGIGIYPFERERARPNLGQAPEP
ncbi:MAG: hypothetical protein WDN28_00895 [Chthoniobacter sp.]